MTIDLIAPIQVAPFPCVFCHPYETWTVCFWYSKLHVDQMSDQAIYPQTRKREKKPPT